MVFLCLHVLFSVASIKLAVVICLFNEFRDLHWAIMVKIILTAVKIPNSVIYHRGWNHLLTSLSSVEKLWYRAGLWKTGRQSEAGTWFLGPIDGDRWVLWYKKKKKCGLFSQGLPFSSTILLCMQLLSDTVLKPSDQSSVHTVHTSLWNVSLHWYYFFLHRTLIQKLMKRILNCGFTPQLKEISAFSLKKGQLVHQKICMLKLMMITILISWNVSMYVASNAVVKCTKPSQSTGQIKPCQNDIKKVSIVIKKYLVNKKIPNIENYV